jgi:sigma-B regulation protein RsbU (phosphoserine phosphatase)
VAGADERDDGDHYDELPCGLLSTQPDGTIVRVNATFLRWTGLRREDLVGEQRFIDLLSPGGRLYHETHYMPTLQMQSSAREMAFEIVCADRSRLPVLVSASLHRDASGAPTLVRVAVFEATQRREYERELLIAKRHAEQSEEHAKVLSRTLQSTLIPPGLPAIDGLDLGAAYRPAGTGEEVGGDFYDVFKIAADDCVLVIGDVCGKGVDAAVVTALVRYTVRAASVEHPEPARVLELVNEVLNRQETDRFCTVALLRLRRGAAGWVAELSLGGHPAPLLRRNGSDHVQEVGRAGSLLGGFRNVTLHDESVALRPGDTLVLFTDGVTEGRHGREFFGEDRLRSVVATANGTAQEIVDQVLAASLAFQQDETYDDIALVALRIP